MEVGSLGRYGVDQQEVMFYLDKYRNMQKYIVVTGEFNAGKSCFINALLGKKDFLPHSNSECTPVLLELVWGQESHMTLKTLDGEERTVLKNQENIRRYGAYRPEYEANLMSLTIPVENFCLGERVHLVDTPGTNTINRDQEALTDYIISKADLILYTLNKTVGESDLRYMRAIRSYTKNMVFIITHTDEEGPSGQRLSDKEITRLTERARGEIAAGLEADSRDLLIFSVGSKEAFANPEKIDEIRGFLRDYLQGDGETEQRDRVRRQLQKLFEDRVAALDREKVWLERQQSADLAEREQKLMGYKKKRRRMDGSQESELSKAAERVEEEKKRCEARIQRLFQSKTQSLISEITNCETLTEEQITDKLLQLHEKLGSEVKHMITDSAGNLLMEAADSFEDQMSQLYEELGIGQEKPIAAPGGRNAPDGFQDMEGEIETLKRQLAACREESEGLRDESAFEREQELNGRLRMLERKYDRSGRQISDLGAYIPEYDELVTEAGGREAGRKIGRIAGEMTDLFLLFWNPGSGASTAVKTTDHIKDWIQGLKMVKHWGNEISAIGDQAMAERNYKPVSGDRGTAGGQSPDKVRQAVQIRNELVSSARQAGGGQFDTVLDMLSIGYWGEKLGGAIGDSVKPVRKILVEHEEVKARYDAERRKLIDEQEALRGEIESLELELLEAGDDIGRRTRLKREVENRRRLLESQLLAVEQSAAERKRESEAEYIREYYDREIGARSRRECGKCCRLAARFYDLLAVRLIQQIQREYEERMAELDRMTELLMQSGSGLIAEITNIADRLEELRGYHEWISEWIS